MRIRLSKHLLVLSLILAVLTLCTEAVAHSHGISFDQYHCTCQVCHVGHVAIPQPAAHAQLKAPLVAARFAPDEKSSLAPESPDIVSIPRAPPVSA